MKNEKTVVTIGGGSLMIPLLCIFVVLKLTNQIDWSWLWVLSPLWLPLAIVLGFVAVVLAFMGLWALIALLVAIAASRS